MVRLENDPNEQTKSAIAGDVKWIARYAGNQPLVQVVCSGYIVPYGPVNGPRGLAGAEDCLRVAVLFYLIQDWAKAITWLCAAQCHSQDAQDRFRSYPDYALQQAVGRYRTHVLRNPRAIIETLDQSSLFRLIQLLVH